MAQNDTLKVSFFDKSLDFIYVHMIDDTNNTLESPE